MSSLPQRLATPILAFHGTADPILIALGLGFIGAMFVRSITVFLVRRGTLSEYIYLEHGAHWAIGALAVILLITVGDIHVPEVVTGLVGDMLVRMRLNQEEILYRLKEARLTRASEPADAR